MPTFIIYLIKANIALTLFYLAYRFGLRRLTFYTLNRFFLLFGIAFSAIFPLINPDNFFRRHEQLADAVNYYAPDWNSIQQIVHPQFTIWNIVQYVFWAGVAAMAVRLSVQLISLFSIHIKTTDGKLNNEKVKLMHDRINPFSFFRNIYINPALHSPEELDNILRHEKIHVKGWHTLDVLCGEINHIFYWFNPGAWLMKTAIRENLEFITDRKILQSGTDAKAYQYSLIHVSAFPYAVPVANNFNFSHLKKRIIMMNKKKSRGYHLLRYLLLLPVIAITAFIINSSRAQSMSDQKNGLVKTGQADTLQVLKKLPAYQNFNEKGYIIRVKMSTGETTVLSKTGMVYGPFNLFSMSREQLTDFNKRFGSKATFEEVQHIKDHTIYLKSHPEISDYVYESADRILVWTGKTSKIYHLNNSYEKGLLLKKYGSIPPVYGHFNDGRPKPPPPKYTPPQQHLSKDYQAFLKRNSSIESFVWTKPENGEAPVAIIHLKNGKTERYLLTDTAEMKKARTKYGNLPMPPPPPPPSAAPIKPGTSGPHGPHAVVPGTSTDHEAHDTIKKDDHYYAQLSYQKAREKDYEAAEKYAHESLRLNPANATASGVLRYVQQMKAYQMKMEEYKKKRGDSAFPEVKVHFIPPKTDKDYAEMAYKAAQEKEYDKSVSYAHKALELNPDNAEAKSVLRYVEQMKAYKWKINEYKKEHGDTSLTQPKVHFKPPKARVDTAVTFNSSGNFFRIQNSDLFLPHSLLYVVNGKEVSEVTVKSLNPDKIESIRVLKDKAAITLYGLKGKNGVIEIITKKNNTIPTSGFHNYPMNSSNGTTAFVPIKGLGNADLSKALILLNNKISNYNEFHSLLPDNIYSVDIIKGKDAVKQYGIKGENGVVKVYTKKYIQDHRENTSNNSPIQNKATTGESL